MSVSALDLFTIGIGPSSSHTVGPMRAAEQFIRRIEAGGHARGLARLTCDLYGSLAATGKGHGTDRAIMLGFLGELPETVEPDSVAQRIDAIRSSGALRTPWGTMIPFQEKRDLDFKHIKPLPAHPNGMHFIAQDSQEMPLIEEIFYSIGGGFIMTEAEMAGSSSSHLDLPHPFTSAAELMQLCDERKARVSDIMLANETAFRPESATRTRLDEIWTAMQECVTNGCARDGVLAGGLRVRRRAKALHDRLCQSPEASLGDPLTILD